MSARRARLRGEGQVEKEKPDDTEDDLTIFEIDFGTPREHAARSGEKSTT